MPIAIATHEPRAREKAAPNRQAAIATDPKRRLRRSPDHLKKKANGKRAAQIPANVSALRGKDRIRGTVLAGASPTLSYCNVTPTVSSSSSNGRADPRKRTT